MSVDHQFDVAIVGGGPAGVTAAAALGKKGYSTIILEAGVYPGAENWSGTVYFSENLVHEEAFGPELFDNAPYERKLVKRGFALYDGVSMFGGSYHNEETFRNCYTVLRPVFDRYLSERVKEWGVTVLPKTTVQSLIREEGRVIGCQTERGPVYADCVFLAEGDASHLTTQEGYEQVEDDRPDFLQGIKEVIELPPEVIEERFDVAPGEGSAFEVLIRNGNIGGSTARLNMGAFLYTNRNSLSIGLVLPLHNLKTEFDGDHNDLMEWFKGLPEIDRWIDGGELSSFGTKIIRGGGFREIPQIVDDGLAIGGAATGIGLDFPYPNFTGPATKMGLLFAQAYDRIQTTSREPNRFTLEDEYVDPLKDSHYYRNVRYLKDFPSYVEKTKIFFERQIDLASGTATIATDPELKSFEKLTTWVRYVRDLLSGGRWKEILQDRKELSQIFELPDHVLANLDPSMIFQWLGNSFQSLLPGAPLPERDEGELNLYFRTSEHRSDPENIPFYFRWIKRRFEEPLKEALNHFYTNDDTPVEIKTRRAIRSVMRGASFLDVMICVPFFLFTIGLMASETIRDLIQFKLLNRDVSEYLNRPEQQYKQKRRDRGTMSGDEVSQTLTKDQKLGTISYFDSARSNIKVFWPEDIQNREELEDSPLWSVCPAHVYEVHTQFLGNPGVVVNYENCIKCETCWRATDDVHWSRATEHRMIYQTYSPSHVDLASYLNQRRLPEPNLPASDDEQADWLQQQRELMEEIQNNLSTPDRKNIINGLERIPAKLGRLRIRLKHFPEHLDDAPPVLETGRLRWLKKHVESIKKTVEQIDLILKGNPFLKVRRDLERSGEKTFYDPWDDLREQIDDIKTAINDEKPFWASLICDRILDHHLPQFSTGLESLQTILDVHESSSPLPGVLRDVDVGSTPEFSGDLQLYRRQIRETFEETFDHQAIKSIERDESFSDEQKNTLKNSIQSLPLSNDINTPQARILVEESARKDPSLAWMISHHLWGLQLLHQSDFSGEKMDPYRSLTHWMAVCAPFSSNDLNVTTNEDQTFVNGSAEFIPCALAKELLVVTSEQVAVCSIASDDIERSRENPSGLKGAGISTVHFNGASPKHIHDRSQSSSTPPWLSVLDAVRPFYMDLTRGASEYLLNRARDHADSRIQFPGQFQDEAGKDTIAKFGAVKEMLSEMETNRYLLETISSLEPEILSPEDEDLAVAAQRFLAGAYYGPEPGSFGYNTGQIFGGTAFSEDDFIAKFYRDSSVTRFLVQHPDRILKWIGRRILSRPELLQNNTDPYQTLEKHVPEEPLLADAWRPFTEARSRLQDFMKSYTGGQTEDPDPPLLIRIGELASSFLALRGALLRTYILTEQGENTEREVNVCVKAAGDLLDQIKSAEAERDRYDLILRTGEKIINSGPFEPVSSFDLPYNYRDFLDTDQQHRTGQSLLKPYNHKTPGYLPEMVSNDPDLNDYAEPLIQEIREKYYTKEDYPEGPFGDGLCYPRYLEELHTLPEEDLEYLLENGHLRVPIDTEYGGEGHWKSFYYLMCDTFMRFADPAMALCIMVNTSIGTTPIQLGLKQDLPRARNDLAEINENPEQLTEIARRIDDLLEQLQNPDLQQLTNDFQECESLVRERIRESGVLKYLSGGFLRTFYDAAQAGQQKDLQGFREHLTGAREQFEHIEDSISEQLDEFAIREKAHKRHLRMISAGWVSAFALTEPTAGSDSGGVKTQAKLKKRRVHGTDTLIDYFYLDEENQDGKRYLLDAARLEFDFDEMETYYRFDEAQEPAKLHFDEYDYQQDRPEGKKRYIVVDGDKKYFHDIGLIRSDKEGDRYYEYFELNGSKMWITNGRFANLFCLYARTEDEGVTGFVVDRHAEGLVVGQDEEKMGQKGSPTNELSLKGVRVPRENVIGVKGRGQVNALEALNAGRTGLAYGSVGIMKDIVERGQYYISEQSNLNDEHPERVKHLFGQMAASIVSTESLSYDLVGYVDHPGTDGIRMESAIGKYYASESVHETITLGERLRGIIGQTGRFDIEKKRRDARVITIYEGTNEVQRFLLLKDLVQNIYEDRNLLEDADRETSAYPHLLDDLQSCRHQLFEHLESAVNRFGDQVWQQVTYQPVFFQLSEMAGLIKLMYVTLSRMDMVQEHLNADEDDYGSLLTSAGELFIHRAVRDFRIRSDRFTRRFRYLEENRYPPEIQLGFQSLENVTEKALSSSETPELNVQDQLDIAVCLKPVPLTAPEPRLHEGELIEPLQQMNPGDRTALEDALHIKEQNPEHVQISLFVVSRDDHPGVEPILRRALALGADRAVRIQTGTRHLSSSLVSSALADTIDQSSDAPDLVLLGSRSTDTGQAAVPPMLAEKLDWLHLEDVSGFNRLSATDGILTWELDGTSWNGHRYTGEGSAVLAFDVREDEEHHFSIQNYLDALSQDIEHVEYPVETEPKLKIQYPERRLQEDGSPDEKATDPESAARQFLKATGRTGDQAVDEVAPYEGDVRSLTRSRSLPESPGGLYISSPVLKDDPSAINSNPLLAGRKLSSKFAEELTVLIPTERKPDQLRHTLGQLTSIGADRLILVQNEHLGRFSWKGHREMLRLFLEQFDDLPTLWMGNNRFRQLFCRMHEIPASPADHPSSVHWFSTRSLSTSNGSIELSTPVLQDRAEAVACVSSSVTTLTTTFSSDLEVPDEAKGPKDTRPDVYSFSPSLSYHPDDDPVSSLMNHGSRNGQMDSIEDANIIVDVGYGVGDGDGMRTLTEPLTELLEDELNLDGVMIGATRKVTQDLELLPTDRQIGQTGVRVNPDLILALGVSGAPQHIDYIGEKATIFSFNIDPDAPLMTLNEDRPAPVVHPITGDMFETIPAFINNIREELS